MAHEEKSSDNTRKCNQYPLDPNSYQILDEIGSGVSAIVYKAICLPMISAFVAIKAIDLDKSKTDFDNIRRECKTMTLLSHPNILKAHCSFTVQNCLWVVMPFMSAGSLQSIITSAFPNGLPEICIAVILKETLNALSYLHNQGHLHRDVKAGNILIDSNGAVKLADFGVSASIYEPNLSNYPTLMLSDFAGTPYWMAPEVIHSHTGYSLKADIWSFGITALELAHGRPPLSHLPPSKSLVMKITTRFRFSDYEKSKDNKNKKFSKSFKDMVGLCLDQDPSKRPSADKLLKHPFFKYCNKGPEFLVKNMLQGLPSVEQRFKESKLQRLSSTNKALDGNGNEDDDDDDDDDESLAGNAKQRRISGWNFNLQDFELNPVFPFEKKDEEDDNKLAKQESFDEKTVIQDKGEKSNSSSGSSSCSSAHPICDVLDQNVGCGVEKEVMLRSLSLLRHSLDEQKQKVEHITALLGGGEENTELSKEEHLMQEIAMVKVELEMEKKRRSDLELELDYLKSYA